MADALRIAVYVGVVALLLTIFLVTSAGNGFRLDDGTKGRVATTPATTVSRFERHFVAGFFHENILHIGFNLAVFTAGYWLATQRAGPLLTVGFAYAIGILTVVLCHVLIVLPLAKLSLPYATRAVDLELVGFSVIAYATLGAGLHALPKTALLATVVGVGVFELAAAFLVTAPFVTLYHLVGFGLGYAVRHVLPSSA